MSYEHRSPTDEQKYLLGEYDTREKATESHREARGSRSNFIFTLVAVLVCVLCTGINIHAFITAGKPEVRQYYDLDKLKRPSQWIGLDRLKMPDEAPEPILIYPNLISVINRAEPSRAYGDDPVRFAQLGGLVPPDDRPLKITSEFSTIVEFRSIDYKMENCELKITSPASGTNVTLGVGENVVDIWKVQSKHQINAKLLTWKTRPARLHKVDTITMTHGMDYTYRFSCPTDTLHTFELCASGDTTHVEWVQDHKKPTPGVVMWQHASFLE
ncbi:hypothetical protein BXZ70DRAFT_117724 [Cristinia sonorae]|uniref:Ubiquitin 3 binding protein But2 C-terminal domain-containing protein n=1 Tax=Cristinia sonorae TaxID=1940300 RepID=A0A8K0UQF5_9AGAR|nr:hypothetical protein BXZ70DRAFT_117724 [Cristinia sonorae]